MGRPLEDPIKRFWDKVDKKSDEECWNWTAYISTGGYGLFWLGNTDIVAHRFSWEIHNGKIPDGLCVLHDCDNRKCSNPKHLFLGTYLDNARDRDFKKRNGTIKINQEEVLNILNIDRKLINVKELCLKYNVHNTTIYSILNRKSWKHLNV